MERFHCVLFAKFDRLTRRQGDLFRSLVASPNVFAVLRLMTRSNFVGCSTPTWSPARRNRSGTFGPIRWRKRHWKRPGKKPKVPKFVRCWLSRKPPK
jgi:hypothetical protein